MSYLINFGLVVGKLTLAVGKATKLQVCLKASHNGFTVAGSPGAPMTAEPLSLLALCALTSNQHTSRRFVSVFVSRHSHYPN